MHYRYILVALTIFWDLISRNYCYKSIGASLSSISSLTITTMYTSKQQEKRKNIAPFLRSIFCREWTPFVVD